MNTEILRDLEGLGVWLFISLLVWRYYRRRAFPLIERYLTFGPRFWTGFVDGCVLWPIGFITSAVLLLNGPNALAASMIMLQGLAWEAYTVVMHARCGQTVGKMVTKVRVVDFRTEGRISLRQAWLREAVPMLLTLVLLGYEVLAILTGRIEARAIANGDAWLANKPLWLLNVLPGLWFLAEVLTMLTNEKRRALHDLIAGTVVVRTNVEQGGAQPLAPSNGGPVIPLRSEQVLENRPR